MSTPKDNPVSLDWSATCWDEQFNPEWRTWNSNTPALIARHILTECAWLQCPILADALEEAGCVNESILTALRKTSYNLLKVAILLFLADPDRYCRLKVWVKFMETWLGRFFFAQGIVARGFLNEMTSRIETLYGHLAAPESFNCRSSFQKACSTHLATPVVDDAPVVAKDSRFLIRGDF